MSQPFFSVIVTTYNRATILPRALKSLMKQSEKDFEVLIIDDGSTDNTKDIVNDLTTSFSSFRYIVQPHAGSTAAKNKGLSSAVGQWLTFLDSDDAYTADHLALRRQRIVRNPDTLFWYGGVRVVGNEYVPDRFDPKKKIHLSECVIGGTFVINQVLLKRLGLFKDMPLGDDAEFFDRMKSAGVLFAKVDNPSYIYYRDVPDSMTNDMN